MGKKVAYRVRNWRKYNRSLINRGNLTLWLADDVLDGWYAKNEGTLGRGRPNFYSDQCIEVALTLRSLFHFPLRAIQGFIEGLFEILDLKLDVPHYSQLSRRASGLQIQYHSKKSSKKPMDLVVDSTGLKIYGEGEWKMRTHGKSKRRTWRKLHVAIDPESMETIAMELTLANTHDDEVMSDLIKGQRNIGNVYADGAYISKNCFDSIADSGGNAVIALRSGTGLVNKNASPGQLQRNRIVYEIWAAGGRQNWKKTSGYHKRSLVETHMFRFKTILGAELSSRLFENQITEAKIKTLILNKMTRLGMPDSYKIV
jgi:hypothetical protein